MLRNFLKNKKAQNTAEYALLIALVVAGIIAMQTYAQRALQARIHDASIYMAQQDTLNGLNSTQYEPYYSQSNYTIDTQSNMNYRRGAGLVGQDSTGGHTRQGFENSTWAPAADMQTTQ